MLQELVGLAEQHACCRCGYGRPGKLSEAAKLRALSSFTQQFSNAADLAGRSPTAPALYHIGTSHTPISSAIGLLTSM